MSYVKPYDLEYHFFLSCFSFGLKTIKGLLITPQVLAPVSFQSIFLFDLEETPSLRLDF